MSDVDAILAQLRGESEHTANGAFSLDRERAREKMRQFQLADPHRWIVLLVRAAVLRGAKHVRVSIDETSVHTDFDGPPLQRADFEELYAAMFARSLAPEIRARRDLALALNAAMALLPEVLRVETGHGDAALAFEMRAGVPDVIRSHASSRPDTRVSLVLGDSSPTLVRLRAPDRAGPEQRLLAAACKWSECAIELEGRPIAFGANALPVRGERRLAAPRSGRCGFVSAGEAATLVVLQHGLVLTTRRLADLPQGFLAVVDGSGLLTDVSHSEPVEDETWVALVAAVRVEARRSLAALAREITAGGQLPHLASATPAWQWRMLREQLVALGTAAQGGDADLLDALLDLPLWRRASGSSATTRALQQAGVAGYTTSFTPAQIPAALLDTFVVDESGARALQSLLPFAVDRDRQVSVVIEQAARRARAEAPVAERPTPAPAPTRAPRPPRKAAPAPTGDPRRSKFLQRPQLFTVQRPKLAVGPIDVEHDGVRCTIGVTASSLSTGIHELARVRVLVERRVLTELKIVCPLSGVDATVSADDLRANPTWNGLADDSARARVHTALAAGVRSVVAELAKPGEDPSPVARAVLGATLAATLMDPLLLRVWNALSHRRAELFTRVVAAIEADGLEPMRARLEAAIADQDPVRRVSASLDPTKPSTASLRVMLAHDLAQLVALPLFGHPPRSLGDLAAQTCPDAGLDGRERDLVRRLTGMASGGVETEAASVAIEGRDAAPSDVRIASDARVLVDSRTRAEPESAASTSERAEPLDRATSREASPASVETDSVTQPDDLDTTQEGPHAIASPPSGAPEVARSEDPTHALVLAVRAELRAVADLDPRIPVDARFDRIAVRGNDGAAIAVADDGGVTIDAAHPVVRTALKTRATDPWTVAIVTSAVYTAVNTWHEAVTDDHEAWFIAAHARHAMRSGTAR